MRAGARVSCAPPVQRTRFGVCDVAGITNVDHHTLTAQQLSAAAAKVALARMESRQLRSEIKAAVTKGAADAPVLAQQFLDSKLAILAASVSAGIGIRYPKRPCLDRVLALPSTFSVQTPILEPDYVRAKAKSSGGFRAIHDFGLKNRTAQKLVAQVVGCYFVPRPWQYTMVGIHKAIADVKKSLKAGREYYGTLDINEQFPSFDEEKLASELPIQKEWVEHVVVGRHLAVEVTKTKGMLLHGLSPHKLLYQARRGIPLGSICSPIVAAYCLSKLQWEATTGPSMFNYADNFLLLASTSSGLEKGIGKLMDAVANIPGGQFTLKLLHQGHAKSGIDFLGHQLFLKGQKSRIYVSLSNQQSIMSKLNKLDTLIAAFEDKPAGGEHLLQMCALCKGWLQAFQECDDIEEWRQFFQANISENAKGLGLSLPHLYQMSGSQFELSTRPYGLIG
jgi:hypothetical protein